MSAGGDVAMRLRVAMCFLGVLLVVGAPLTARADDAPIAGVPGSVRPVHAASVRMESESVQIIVYGAVAECRADFRLVNSGRQRTLRLAFPSTMPATEEYRDYPPDTLGAFHAWRNGRPLPVRLVEGMDGPLGSWFYEHTVTLPTGATTVTVSYLFRTDQYESGMEPPPLPRAPVWWNEMDGSFNSVGYVLHTGAMWSGPIGTAVVRVTFDDSCERWGEDALATDPVVTTPGWTKPDPRTFQWVFRDFEPTQGATSGTSPYDIRLGFEVPDWGPVDEAAQIDAESDSDADLAADFEYTTFSLWQNWWRQPFIANTTAASSIRAIGPGEGEGSPFWEAGTPFYNLPSTAWGVRGRGARSWFAVKLSHARHIAELRIVPGLADADFRKYSRPKTIIATFSDRTKKTLHIADDPRMQRFPVDVVTSSVRFRIAESYRGTKDPAMIAVALADLGPTRSPAWLSFADALRGVRTQICSPGPWARFAASAT